MQGTGAAERQGRHYHEVVVKFEEIIEILKERFGNAIGDPVVDVPDHPYISKYVFCDSSMLVEICLFLKKDRRLMFEHLSAVTGTDYPQAGEIQLAYVLTSYLDGGMLIIKTKTDRANPSAPSVCGVWCAANWHEREIFDLLGVNFTGHPDMRKLFMPDDWKGHPLRKDYKEEDEYHGMPTKRPPAG